MDAELLTTIGGYRVERSLGKGGMGRVYLCHDEALSRRVAIKVLHPDLVEQTEMRARFQREARALARVSSPFVVTIYAVGDDAVVGPFVVMELLEGEDLQSRLAREQRLPWRDALRMTRDAVQGLLAAEAAGIVHRDIKPANLFDVGDRVKLTDFGLARDVDTGPTITQAGLVVGTPGYLAPELARGGTASAQSDCYSLGATLFHLVAGRMPFEASSPLEVLVDALHKEAPRLRALVADVPPALDELVHRMLAKSPQDRPASWRALHDELERLLGAAADGANPGGAPAPPAAVMPAANPAANDSSSSESALTTVTMELAPSAARTAPVAPAATSAPATTAATSAHRDFPLPTSKPLGASDGGVGRPRARGMGLVGAAVVVGAVCAALWVSSRDDRLGRIDAGQAAAVAREIELMPVGEQDGTDLLLLGHARWALGERAQAFVQWQRARDKGALDDRVLRAALQSLDVKEHDGAVPLLATWPNDGPEALLRELLRGTAWWPRHHALAVLEERGRVTDEDRMEVALLDLAAETCGDRRAGLLALKKIGQGARALEAIRRIRADMLGNACMIFDLPGAEDAVRKRTNE